LNSTSASTSSLIRVHMKASLALMIRYAYDVRQLQ